MTKVHKCQISLELFALDKALCFTLSIQLNLEWKYCYFWGRSRFFMCLWRLFPLFLLLLGHNRLRGGQEKEAYDVQQWLAWIRDRGAPWLSNFKLCFANHRIFCLPAICKVASSSSIFLFGKLHEIGSVLMSAHFIFHTESSQGDGVKCRSFCHCLHNDSVVLLVQQSYKQCFLDLWCSGFEGQLWKMFLSCSCYHLRDTNWTHFHWTCSHCCLLR